MAKENNGINLETVEKMKKNINGDDKTVTVNSQEKKCCGKKPCKCLIITIVVALVIDIAFAIGAYFYHKQDNTYNLNEYLTCVDETTTITLPSQYYMGDPGYFYHKEDKEIKSIGMISCYESEDSYYDTFLEEYSKQYDVAEIEINGAKTLYISLDYTDTYLNYYFIFNNGHVIELILEADQDLANSIANSIK